MMSKNKPGGSPDYRNREGQSGLDPVDTYKSQANIEGTFLQRLFAFNLRTRNIFSLMLMLVFGVSTTILMLMAGFGVLGTPTQKNPDFIENVGGIFLIFVICLGLFIGIALLINFSINLGIVFGLIKDKNGLSNEQKPKRKEAKKKLPKRRKDFK